MFSSNVLIREHVRGVYRHLYAHSYHGNTTDTYAATFYLWKWGSHSQGLCVPTYDAHPDAIDGFISNVGLPNWLIEVDPELDATLISDLPHYGWKPGHDLPVHCIPTDPEWSQRLTPLPAGFTVREVTTDADVIDFAYVQDAAHASAYKLPKGCASQFFTTPRSLIGPNTLACTVYSPAGMPIRTGQLIRAEGLVSGVSGAVDPAYQGKHLGEEIWRFLLVAARERFGVAEVLHETMPIAMPIATRMQLETLTTLHRWEAIAPAR